LVRTPSWLVSSLEKTISTFSISKLMSISSVDKGGANIFTPGMSILTPSLFGRYDRFRQELKFSLKLIDPVPVTSKALNTWWAYLATSKVNKSKLADFPLLFISWSSLGDWLCNSGLQNWIILTFDREVSFDFYYNIFLLTAIREEFLINFFESVLVDCPTGAFLFESSVHTLYFLFWEVCCTDQLLKINTLSLFLLFNFGCYSSQYMIIEICCRHILMNRNSEVCKSA